MICVLYLFDCLSNARNCLLFYHSHFLHSCHAREFFLDYEDLDLLVEQDAINACNPLCRLIIKLVCVILYVERLHPIRHIF